MDKGVALTVVNWIIAFLPILVLLSSILLFNWGAPKSGAVSWFTAIIIGIFYFGADERLLALANSKGMSLSLYVLLIIWSAVFLYNIVERLGAIKVIGDTMSKVTENKILQCLLMAWCFASFMQGIAGFGVPVAVVAPIMVVMGFTPVTAAATCLVGYAWSISFGSMGSSYYTIQLVTKIPGEIIGPWMAILFLVPIVATGFGATYLNGGFPDVKKATPAILVTSVVMGFMMWLMNFFGAAQLATLIPGILGCGTIAALSRTRFYRVDKTVEQLSKEAAPHSMSFHLAFSPYYTLILLTILAQIKPVAHAFSSWVWGLDYPEVHTAFGYMVKSEKLFSRISIYHPAPLLVAAIIISYLVYSLNGKWQPGVTKAALKATFTRCVPTSIGIATMVMMAMVMNDTGMTSLLARGIANATGVLFPVFSPFIGVLGAFLTGSNTNSNVMFGALQVETARVLGISTVIIAAAQSVGASVACCTAPSTVLVGTSTLGLSGRENEVINRTLPYCLIFGLLVGISAWIYACVLFPSLP